MRLSRLFHCCCTAERTVAKCQPAFSVIQSAFAFPVLTYDRPTLAWTTLFEDVSNVR
jgi:hypothetical protein